MSNGELEIQKLLIQRLQRRVEEVEKEIDSLAASLSELSRESSAKQYVLEEEKDRLRNQRDNAQIRLMDLEAELRLYKKKLIDLQSGRSD
jgi:predicted  nucleic acid-binding Zn-ribbon protein